MISSVSQLQSRISDRRELAASGRDVRNGPECTADPVPNDGSNEGHGMRTQVADHQRHHHYPSSRVDVARSSPALASPRPTRSVGALYFFSGWFSRVAVVAHRSRVLRPAYTAADSPLRPSLIVVRATLPPSDLFILFFYFFWCFTCNFFSDQRSFLS